MKDKRAVWEAAKQDQELARILRYLGERGMLGRGAEIEVESDGKEARWRNDEFST